MTTAADPNCLGSGIDPDSKPMYHDGAPGIPDSAGYEPCDCVLTAATDRDTTPAERIQAYLDAYDHQCAVLRQEPVDVLGLNSTLTHGTVAMRRSDLRAVLAEHQQMRETLAELGTPEIQWNIGHHSLGGIWTGVTNYTEAGARHHAAAGDGFPVRRLVGEWQPVDGGITAEPADSCRPVTLPSGETVRVRGAREMTGLEAAALGELVDAARRKMAAENPPEPGSAALYERIRARCDTFDLSLRDAAREAGVRFSTLFRVGQGIMPGADDLAAIEAWLSQ